MRISLLLLSVVALATSATAAIDFTPTTGERVLEGITFKQLIFHQDGRVITYEQPLGWNYSGDAGSFKMTPPKVAQAQATIEQSPLPNPQAFDPATTQQLQQQVLASVPGGAQNVALVSEEMSPVRINQNDTYAVTVSYSYYGEDYETSVLFCNLPGLQLRFRTVARKADFDAVRRAFRGSLFSLTWQP